MKRLLVLVAVASVGCTRELPPPGVPHHALGVDTSPLSPAPAELEGSAGTVTIATDVPARVERARRPYDRILHPQVVRTAPQRTRTWEVLCPRTPCKVRLSYGDHELKFIGLEDDGRTSTAWVKTDSPNVAVSHTLGQQRGSTGMVVGTMMILAGIAAIVVPYGLDLERKGPTPPLLLGLGGAAVFGGVAVMGFFPGTSQEGSTAHWPAEPRTQITGVSLRTQF